MDTEAEEKKAKMHLFMKALHPGCRYAILVQDPKNEDVLEVSTTFERDDFLEILTDLTTSLLDGSANETKKTISDSGFSKN